MLEPRLSAAWMPSGAAGVGVGNTSTTCAMNRYPLPADGLHEKRLSGSSFSTWRILRMAALMLLSASRNTFLPQIDDLVPATSGLSPLSEEQQFHGNPLQLENPAIAAQFISTQIQLEIFPKPNLVCHFDRVGNHKIER